MRRAGSHRGHLEGVVCASVVQVVTHAGNKQGEDLDVPEGEVEKRNVTQRFLLGTSEKTAGGEAQGPPSRELPESGSPLECPSPGGLRPIILCD